MKQLILLIILFACPYLQGQNVNNFTGGFSYNVPLMVIPSNKGGPVSLDASYQAGIQMNQQASEIGLGWSLNSENAIYRRVSGIPDDTKSFNAKLLPKGTPIVNGYGSLYPSSSGIAADLTHIKRGLDTAEFTYPDFDNYTLAGPLLSGQLQPSYYKFYTYNFDGTDYSPSGANSYRKPQFHFAGDFADTLVSRHYSISPATTFKAPTDAITGLGFASSTAPFIGKHLNNTTISNQNFDTISGLLATSNIVEYFTNAEIDAANYNAFSQLDAQNIFIDYKSDHLRSSSVFPVDGIGYFRITASNGLTFHYSLPVYEIANTSYKIPLNNDYSIVSGLATTDLPDAMGDETIDHPDNVNVFVKSKTYNKTAIKWLLVAVTGPDFVDSNGNHMADGDDGGFWMSYDYQLWSGNFVKRSPCYGYDFQYIPDALTQQFPAYFPFAQTITGYPYKTSGLFGSVEVNKTEVYHLSRIRTNSHSAIFIRDIRSDERSSDSSVTIGSLFKPAPDLLLKKIVLFKNEHLDSLLLIYPKTSFTTSNYTDFSFSAVNNSTNIFTSAWFSQNYSALNPSILKRIDFSQDYSLCRKYHNNINSNYVASSVLTSPNTVESNITTNNYSSSGKLTLNGIYTYEYRSGKLIPSIQFYYNAGTSPTLSNPDYNPKKVDYWGYYKSDATQNSYSRYTTPDSKDFTKVWSLLKITNPLGSTTEMEYESNIYQKVIDNEAPNGVRGAAFIYRIQMANTIGATSFNIDMEEGNGSSNWLSEFSSFTPANIPGLKSRVCIPYFEATCYNGSGCVYYSPLSTHQKGFIFGDCTFTLQSAVPGNPYNVLGAVLSPPSNIRHAYTLGDNILFTGASTLAGSTINNYSPSNTISDFAYSGNGFLMCETPIGYEAYGGGIRVKRIKIKNSINEVYTTEYSYENGVATGEMDRFDYQILKRRYVGSVLRYDFLGPKNNTLFDLAPYIGYTKVTVRNMGRAGIPNGKTETTFITDPSYSNAGFGQNYSLNTVAAYGPTSYMKVLNECVVEFANIFGRESEFKLFDKNNNMMTRTIYEYEKTQQGALTENLHFEDPNYRGSCNLQTVNIFRTIPVFLKKVTNYGMGEPTIEETLERDEITGEGVAIRSVGSNSSSSISFRRPAYRHYQPLESIDFTQPAFRKILPLSNNMYSYSNVDSAFTPTGGNGYSTSFAKASYKLYSKVIRQRVYSSGLVATVQNTLTYYVNNRSFVFDAGIGSENAYGLISKSNFGINPLNLSTINNSLFWEPSTTYYWKLVYENTLFDNYKNLVEVRDANDRFSSKRFGYSGYHENASVSNCNYASFTFADFETLPPNTGTATIDGDVRVNNHTFTHASVLVPHTGARSIQITSTPVSFTTASEMSSGGTLEIGLQSGRIYRASVWTHTTNLSKARLVVTINGTVNVTSPYTYSMVLSANSTTNLVTTMGAWNLLQLDFELPEKFSTGTGTPLKIELKSSDNSAVYFDDLVFHPVESNFLANVYDPRNGRVTSTIDGNGLATGYIYDLSGRVSEVWKEVPDVGYKKIKKHTYNYARGAAN